MAEDALRAELAEMRRTHATQLEQANQQLHELRQQLLSLQSQGPGAATTGHDHASPSAQTEPPSVAAAAPPQVHRVAVKLPPLWADRPAVWFAQAESQFELSGISSETTRYSYVVSQLDCHFAAEVEDILLNPPTTAPYSLLKSELIRRLSASEQQRVRQLISGEELGDRKPSQFLRHLRHLAGSAQLDDKFLRELWLQRLPTTVQAILATQCGLAMDKLADLADKVLEVAPAPVPTAVYAARARPASPGPPAAPPITLDALASRLDELSRQLAALQPRRHREERPRPRTRSPSQRGERPPPDGICWYHARFGSAATKCQTPCAMAENFSGNQ